MVFREVAASLLVVLLLATSSLESLGPAGSIPNISSCKNIEGSVTDMTTEGDVFVVWVEAYGNTELSGRWRVHVSNSTYENTEIGEQFERVVCDLLVWDDWMEVIENLKGTGALTPIE